MNPAIITIPAILASLAVFSPVYPDDNGMKRTYTAPYQNDPSHKPLLMETGIKQMGISAHDRVLHLTSFFIAFKSVDKALFLSLSGQDTVNKDFSLDGKSRVVIQLEDGTTLATIPPGNLKIEYHEGIGPLICGHQPYHPYHYYWYELNFGLSTEQMRRLAKTPIKSARLYITREQYFDLQIIHADEIEELAAGFLNDYYKHFGNL